MKKYAVAFTDIYARELKITIVESNDPEKALLLGASEFLGDRAANWLFSLLEYDDIEVIQKCFLDADLLIEVREVS